MKKFVVSLMVMLCCAANTYAYDFKKITDDSRIIAALNVLEQTRSYSTLNALYVNTETSKGVKVMFYELSLISFEYKNHYALASTDNFGQNYIMINSKYKNSPKEAIACLIAHEAIHVLPKATMDEEVRATVVEVQQWIKCLELNPELKNIDAANNGLVKRLNELAQGYTQNGITAITQKISSNDFYQKELTQ